MATRKKTAKPVVIPPSFGDIDIVGIGESIGLKGDELYKEYSQENLQKAIELIMDVVFSTFLKKHKKTKTKSGKITYEYKKFECYLAVYVENGNVNYTLRLNTINNNKTLTCAYFNGCKFFDMDDVFRRILTDFSWLANECARLPYTWEATVPSTLYPTGLRNENGGIPSGYGENLLTKYPLRY